MGQEITDFKNHVAEIFHEDKTVFRAQELLDMDKDGIPFLCEPLFPQTGLAAVGGSSDLGKSVLLRQLAMCIVLGNTEFLGFKLNPVHKRVIYQQKTTKMRCHPCSKSKIGISTSKPVSFPG